MKLMKSNPRSVIDHRDLGKCIYIYIFVYLIDIMDIVVILFTHYLVLKCLNDDDITIRTQSLELLAGIVSKKSLVDLVRHLLGVRKIVYHIFCFLL